MKQASFEPLAKSHERGVFLSSPGKKFHSFGSVQRRLAPGLLSSHLGQGQSVFVEKSCLMTYEGSWDVGRR